MNWLLYAILGAVLAGASPVLAKAGMRKSNSHLAAALRGTVLFVGAWFMVNTSNSGMKLSGIGTRNFMYLILSGIVTGLLWICLLRALQLGEVIKVIPILEVALAMNMLVGIFGFGDMVSWNKIIILCLLIFGALMMGLKGNGRGGKTGAWLGYGVGAAVLTTVTNVLDRIGISGVNTYFERLVQYGVAMVFVWVVVFATRGYKGLRSMSFLDGMYLCFSGAAMTGAWYCFYKAYILGVNATVRMTEYFDLVAAVVLGCVFMRERLTVRAIFGMIFMMLGFWLIWADLPTIPL